MYNIAYFDFVAIIQDKDYKSENISLWGHSWVIGLFMTIMESELYNSWVTL
jgi:hypothetical protein